MGIILKYTKQNPKTGRIDYRRRFPDEVRAFLPGKPVELKRSLKSKDIQSPSALEQYHAAQAEFARKVALARKARDRAFDILKPPMIALLAVEFENGWRKEADENWKWTLPDETGELSFTDEMLDNFGTWKIEQDLTEIIEHWTSAAQSLVEQQGLVLDPETLTAWMACAGL